MNEIQWAVDIFEKNGIKTRLNKDNMIIISHYCQPKEKTFSEMGINEDDLIKNVVGCLGKFETRKSKLTTFPLVAAQEIAMDKDIEIVEMPNLKAVNIFLVNSHLKKLPKLKAVGSMTMENSKIKTLPKLKDAAILIVQNSALSELSSLEHVERLCIIDSNVTDIKSLKNAGDVFICSSDENNKIDLAALPELEEINNLFVANTNLKALPKLKKAKKIALYNCNIKSVKPSIGAEVEIEVKISDEQLSEKFDTFTDWYNSDVFQHSMNIIGDVVNQIQG